MTSFFLFEGLERLSPDVEADELWQATEDATARRGDADDDRSEEDEDLEDPPDLRQWRQLLNRHTLVRQARSFVRSCALLGKQLTGGLTRDREAVSLIRNVRQVPETLAEALVAEVNGADHQSCDAACVAYDINCLVRTRRSIVESFELLERLLTRYPEKSHDIVELLNQAQRMETTIARRIMDMMSRWAKKERATDDTSYAEPLPPPF